MKLIVQSSIPILFCAWLSAFQVDPLPAGNLVVNPWFRDFDDPIHAGLSGWEPDLYWGISQKNQNPTPDPTPGAKCGGEPYCGTMARLFVADADGRPPGDAIPGVPAYLSQVVEADPAVTRFSFGLWWTALRMEQAEARIYSGPTANGPWELVWIPFEYSYLGGVNISNFTYRHTGYSEADLEGSQFYRIELYGLPTEITEDGGSGIKFTGLYFGPSSGECLSLAEGCSDQIDNDCDGAVDCEDEDCWADPTCLCSEVGMACLTDTDCCDGTCRRGTCREPRCECR